MLKVYRIRKNTGERYEPAIKADGRYQLADPAHGSIKHHKKHAIYTHTIEEAVELIKANGFSLWMRGKLTGQRNLIAPQNIVIERV